MKHKKTVIIGATAFALGLASIYKNDCLVIGLDSTVCGEFADAMDNSKVDFSNLSPHGQELCDELKSRGVLNALGELHILALSGVSAKRFLDSCCELLLDTIVVSVEYRDDKFILTLFSTVDGYMKISADNLIDTTVNEEDLEKYSITKTYGVMLVGEESFPKACGNFTKGYFADEYILRLDVPIGASIPDAQKLTDEFLFEHSEVFKKAKVASTALTFGYRVDSEINYVKNGIKHIPSGAFPDVVTSFDRGTLYANELLDKHISDVCNESFEISNDVEMPFDKKRVTQHTTVEGENISHETEVCFDETCDILVIGLGTAGAVSAIAAGKRGHKVIGVDFAPLPGGVGTAACVWDYYYGAKGGLYEEINHTADKILGSGKYMPSAVSGGKISYPTTVKSIALEETLSNYGVKCIYNTVVTDIYTDGEKVVGAAFLSNGKHFKIGASVIIDGAEGAVCKLLGKKTLGGRCFDNKTARASRTVGILTNENGVSRVHGCWRFCGEFSNKNAYECAKAIYEWTASEPGLYDRFNEKNRLCFLGSVMAKREVFCCETETVYTFKDYLDGNIPNDVIFYTFAPLDNSNRELWDEDIDFQDWQGLSDMHAYGYTAGVTPKMLIPKGSDGLILAGKHIGTGHTMSAGVRMRTDMEKCGEAAGVMASLTVEYSCKVAELGANEIRNILSKTNCYDKSNDRGICDLNVPYDGMWKSAELPHNVAELKEILSGIHPALGLIAVRMRKINAVDNLKKWIFEDGLLSENSAVALGLLGDVCSLPILRKILSKAPEAYVYHSPNKYFFPWLQTTELCNYVKAACLVARFNLPEDRQLLNNLASYSGDDERKIAAASYAKKTLPVT